MTKKEMYEAIKELAILNDRADIYNFANEQIDLLEKRYDKVAEKKAEERNMFKEAVLAVLEQATEPMRTSEIASVVGISPQKASPLLKVLVAEGTVKRIEEKKVITFMLM